MKSNGLDFNLNGNINVLNDWASKNVCMSFALVRFRSLPSIIHDNSDRG